MPLRTIESCLLSSVARVDFELGLSAGDRELNTSLELMTAKDTPHVIWPKQTEEKPTSAMRIVHVVEGAISS